MSNLNEFHKLIISILFTKYNNNYSYIINEIIMCIVYTRIIFILILHVLFVIIVIFLVINKENHKSMNLYILFNIKYMFRCINIFKFIYLINWYLNDKNYTKNVIIIYSHIYFILLYIYIYINIKYSVKKKKIVTINLSYNYNL